MSQPDSWFTKVPYTNGLEDRRSWYSSIAEAYDRARPRYSKEIIDRAIQLACLPQNADILEVGCGPGTATIAFAERGFSIQALEPSEESCAIAQQNCAAYRNVTFLNTTFEEWTLTPQHFDAVLAATSFHWIPTETRYSKTAAALKDNGALILLWNTPPQPSYEFHQTALLEIYQTLVPSLVGYEEQATYEKNFRRFGESILESGFFADLITEQWVHQVTYRVEDYLALLSTLSPYIALGDEVRSHLFSRLREALLAHCGDAIALSYLSVLQVAKRL
jgi:ubiquinone/menaquinone biosynthesis C-methylase UbiE